MRATRLSSPASGSAGEAANGANGWQYRQWALSVAGVGDAKVVELAQGPGTVGVTIVDSNMAPASPEIVEACQALLDAHSGLWAPR